MNVTRGVVLASVLGLLFAGSAAVAEPAPMPANIAVKQHSSSPFTLAVSDGWLKQVADGSWSLRFTYTAKNRTTKDRVNVAGWDLDVFTSSGAYKFTRSVVARVGLAPGEQRRGKVRLGKPYLGMILPTDRFVLRPSGAGKTPIAYNSDPDCAPNDPDDQRCISEFECERNCAQGHIDGPTGVQQWWCNGCTVHRSATNPNCTYTICDTGCICNPPDMPMGDRFIELPGNEVIY